ncbi:MAG: helicase-related protein [Rubrivivax sp.]
MPFIRDLISIPERVHVIVATSTLELGIDVGDLDRVIQIDAPATVGSLLQRMGRSGRRTGSRRYCLFLATTDSALINALGIVDLWSRGWVEALCRRRNRGTSSRSRRC